MVHRAASLRHAWLVVASLVFYGVSGADNLTFLLGSVAANFLIGRHISDPAAQWRRAGLWLGVSANVGLLALSFVTFQQIGFLVECWRGRIGWPILQDYCLFVLFFPQLIIGPIVQYSQIAGQVTAGALARRSLENLAVGFSIFIFGLFKKAVVADSLAVPVADIFHLAAIGQPAGGPVPSLGGAGGGRGPVIAGPDGPGRSHRTGRTGLAASPAPVRPRHSCRAAPRQAIYCRLARPGRGDPGQLAALLDDAARRGIEIVLFINPSHPDYLPALAEAGQDARHAAWRADMADLAGRNARPGLANLDFTDLGASEIGCRGTLHPPCPFVDLLHYRPEIGRRIRPDGLERLRTAVGQARQ